MLLNELASGYDKSNPHDGWANGRWEIDLPEQIYDREKDTCIFARKSGCAYSGRWTTIKQFEDKTQNHKTATTKEVHLTGGFPIPRWELWSSVTIVVCGAHSPVQVSAQRHKVDSTRHHRNMFSLTHHCTNCSEDMRAVCITKFKRRWIWKTVCGLSRSSSYTCTLPGHYNW